LQPEYPPLFESQSVEVVPAQQQNFVAEGVQEPLPAVTALIEEGRANAAPFAIPKFKASSPALNFIMHKFSPPAVIFIVNESPQATLQLVPFKIYPSAHVVQAPVVRLQAVQFAVLLAHVLQSLDASFPVVSRYLPVPQLVLFAPPVQ